MLLFSILLLFLIKEDQGVPTHQVTSQQGRVVQRHQGPRTEFPREETEKQLFLPAAPATERREALKSWCMGPSWANALLGFRP